MVGKIFRSFVPYLGVLIGLFVALIILDSYAEKISDEPLIIDIRAASGEEKNSIIQFETDEQTNSVAGNKVVSDSIFIRAVHEYKNGNYHRSKESFKQLEFIYPDNATACNYLGLLYLKEKQFEKAYHYFLKATSIDSSFFSAHINLAVVLSRMHRYRNAEHAYLRAVNINPFHPKPFYNLGLLFYRNENWNKASDAFFKSIELSSGDQKAKSHCYYGIVRLNLQDTVQAKESFNKAVEYKPDYQLPRIYLSLISPDRNIRENELKKVYRLNPNSFYANFYLGTLYAQNKQISNAEYHLRKALEINPDDEKVIEELSSFYINQQRYEEAGLIIGSFAENDTLPQSYFHEARLSAKKGNLEEAIRLYELAQIKSGHDYPEAALNQAILYKQKADFRRAAESYRNALKMKPDYAVAYFNLALLYQEQGEMEKAIDNYESAIQFDPASSKSWYNLAIIYEVQKKYDKALDAYTNAIEIEQDYLKALSSLGILYARLDRYDKAVETYEILLNHYPDYSKGYFNLGLAYGKLKQYEQAVSAYARVIEINPENIRAKMNIGVLYARTGDIDLAIKTFEDASDMDVDNAEIRFNLALQYEKAGKIDEAVYQYSMAIQLNTNYKKAYDKLTRLYKDSGDSVSYFIVSLKRLKLDPDGEKYYELGKKLYNAAEFNYAMMAFNNAIDNGVKEKWSEYWKAMIFVEQNDFDSAIRLFQGIISSDPGHKFALYRMGQVFELLGLPDKAIQYYDRLKNLDPDFKIVHRKKINVTKKGIQNGKEKG